MKSASVVQIAPLVLGLSTSVLSAQTICIKLVDGRNGRPKAGSHVNVWVGKERKSAIVIPTDKDGVASLALTEVEDEVNVPRVEGYESRVLTNPVVKSDDDLQIKVPFVLCQPGGPDYSWLAVRHFSTKRVLKEGIATANTCGKATASPEPGDLIIFVRPLSWWEKLNE
ncbi:MAG TPA: hypothetical protein VMD76_10310 [Candidatus Sulfotelmatobacter sp.]|nr:hypothetical protein [Candidatus Sulfotelmatobacter sp.]